MKSKFVVITNAQRHLIKLLIQPFKLKVLE